MTWKVWSIMAGGTERRGGWERVRWRASICYTNQTNNRTSTHLVKFLCCCCPMSLPACSNYFFLSCFSFSDYTTPTCCVIIISSSITFCGAVIRSFHLHSIIYIYMYCWAHIYIKCPIPLFMTKFLHRVERECIKGPPTTKVLSSSAKPCAVRFGILKMAIEVKNQLQKSLYMCTCCIHQ